jgi:hypothetical protein
MLDRNACQSLRKSKVHFERKNEVSDPQSVIYAFARRLCGNDDTETLITKHSADLATMQKRLKLRFRRIIFTAP